MRLTKEEFCKYLNKYKESMDFFYALDTMTGGSTCGSKYGLAADCLYNLINDLCDFTEESYKKGTLVDWFVYDTDFGLSSENCKLSIDDVEYIVDTPEKLYDILVKIQTDEMEMEK